MISSILFEVFFFKTVHSPLFFSNFVEIGLLPVRAANLVSYVPTLAWRGVSNLLMGRGTVWEEASLLHSRL